MNDLEVEWVNIGDSRVFKNQFGYSNVTKRLASFTLKGTQEEYRFWIFYNPNLGEWQPQPLPPVHISTVCSICEDKKIVYEKGELCEGIKTKDLENIWGQIKEDPRSEFKLLFI